MAFNDVTARRTFERRFFWSIALLFPIAVLVGFGPTYYLKGFFSSPAIPSSVVHLHGIVMSAWILLFVTQVYLISSKRVKVHQKLGIAGVVLGILVIGLGFMTGVESAQRGASVPGIPPLQFLIVPIGDVLVFAILFAAAIYYRRNSANHKRLILLTVINFLPPALGRFPFDFVAAAGPLWFYGVPDLLAIIFVAVDTWRNKRLNVVFLAAAIFLIASHWIRLAVMPTPFWVNVAAWLTGVLASSG